MTRKTPIAVAKALHSERGEADVWPYTRHDCNGVCTLLPEPDQGLQTGLPFASQI